MKNLTPDIVFIHPNAADSIYQGLSKFYAAVEPPIWAGMLTQRCLNLGFNAEIMDCEALNMADDEALYHINNMRPRVVAFVIYGQHPSASAQNMEGAVRLAEKLKKQYPEFKILFVGGLPSALPIETLEKHRHIDYVCDNEGFYTIPNLLKLNPIPNILDVPGLYFRKEDNIVLTSKEKLLPKEELNTISVPWQMLPMKHYRTSLWHSYSNNCERQPFASLYTSLGCPYSCSFCCINAPFGGKSSFRWWDPEDAIRHFAWFDANHIVNIKIADELFVLNPRHFLRLCELIIERKYHFNIWAYARIDTVKDEYLATLKKAGVNWLALGIESANKRVRKDVTKGRFEDVDIVGVVKKIREHGINVIGNYIFGLPEDNMSSMKETLDLAKELNTEAVNFYVAMAYPGSQLYTDAKEKGIKLPETYSGWSQYAYDTQPLPTKYLSAEQVLKFRDDAWFQYHTNTDFLRLIQYKFGSEAVKRILDSTKIKLKRKILGD